MELLLQDSTGARMLPNCTATFFDYKTVRGHAHATKLYGGFFYFRIRGLLHIFYYKTYGGHYQTARRAANTLMMAAFFPVENRSISIILYTYYTLAFTAT